MPPRRSRSRDRRQSLSLIDAVFRRRRHPSVSDQLQESSDSEASTDLPAVTTTTTAASTWRSETCRQLVVEGRFVGWSQCSICQKALGGHPFTHGSFPFLPSPSISSLPVPPSPFPSFSTRFVSPFLLVTSVGVILNQWSG